MKNKKQKTNKQIYTKFGIMVVAGCLIGFLAGFGGAFISDMYGGDIVAALNQIFTVATPVAYVLLMVVAYSISFIKYGKAKNMVTEWDGIDEDVLDEADKKLGEALEPSNIMMVCNFFLYSAMTYISGVTIPGMEKNDGLKEGLPVLVVAVGLFVFNMVIITIIQKLVVDLTKKINPEKRGNIFDSEFNKVWINSCDEAQKQTIYQAGYKAYQATGLACLIVWLLSLIGMLMFDIGILPSVCVFAIWLTMVLAYTIACRQVEKKK